MEDESAASLERNALQNLHNEPNASLEDCTCSNKEIKSQLLCGWKSTNKQEHSTTVRLKVKKNSHASNSKIWTLKSKPQGFRNSKADIPDQKGYFRNYNSRKQHIMNYTNQFSTVKEASLRECMNADGEGTRPGEHHMDPYMPPKGDQGQLYNRLKLLQTLSDFYSLGVSPRDFRKQHSLPPVNITRPPTKSYYQSVNETRKREMDDNSHEIDSKRIEEKSEIKVEKNDGNRSIQSRVSLVLETTDNRQSDFPMSNCASYSRKFELKASSLSRSSQVSSSLKDLRKPSQSLIESLPSSLRAELKVIRSGHELKRNGHLYNPNSDRFVGPMIKQRPVVKNERIVTVKDKTASSIPHSQKSKPFYISILGKNPLAKDPWESI